MIGDCVTNISSNAFYDCDGLSSLEIPSRVTLIGSYAFYDCSNLTSIAIPESMTSIDSYAFRYCNNLSLVFNSSNLNIIKGYSDYGYVGCYANQIIEVDSIINDFYFYTSDNGINYLSYYSGQDSIPVLPENYGGRSYAIGDYAFYNRSNLLSITIPSGVSTIGSNAFSGCSNLSSITIPSSITAVGNYAFDNCIGLKELIIENGSGTLSLGYNGSYQGLFYDCPLERVHLGRNLSYSSNNSYGYSPFYNKDELFYLTIGGEVTAIGDYAFRDCDKLNSITISANIASIGYEAFSNLKKVTWLPSTPPAGYTNISASLNYVPNQQYESLYNTKVYPYLSSSFDIDGIKFVPINPSERTCCVLDCAYDSTATTINVGESITFRGVTMQVEEIAPYAFAHNKYIKEVFVSHNGNIGDHAFYDCDSIQRVTIRNQGSVGSQAFYGCGALETVVLDNIALVRPSSEDTNFTFPDWISTNHSSNSNSSETYTFTIPVVGTLQFDWLVSSESGYDWLTVSLDGIEIVRRSGSYSGSYLNEELSIGEHTIVVRYSKDGSQSHGSDQASISNIIVTSSSGDVFVEGIGRQVFEDCISLQSVTLGDSIKVLGSEMFKGCTSLQEIVIPDSVVHIGECCFQNCTSLSEVTISQSLQRVGRYAFSGCSSLLEFVVPQTLVGIGNNAFEGCSLISAFTVPSATMDIGDYAFSGCTGLTEFIIEDRTEPLSLGSNGSSALFSDCPLDSVYIGGKIAESLFEDSSCSPFYCNTSLRSVVISNNEELICANEFYGCTNLSNVIIGNGVNAIGDYAFYSCTNLRNVIIGNGVSTIGDYAFYACSNLNSLTIGSNMESLGYGAFSGCVNLSSITSRAVVPPSCNAQALDDINKWQCVLYVPLNSASAYQMADHWKEFFYIDGSVEIEKYQLTYTVDGEVYFVDSLAHKAVVIMLEEPTREGYTFSGWDKTLTSMLPGDVEINGYFSVNAYEVKYVVNDEVYHIDSVAYGERIEPIERLTQEGYTFEGWNDVLEIMPARDIVISGRFYPNRYQVTYIIDDNVVYSDSIEYGMPIVTPTILEKEGYTLSWGNVPETMPAEDLVYYGCYVVNSYKLSFVLDDDLYAVAQVEYGTPIALPDAPEIEGYTFSWGDVPEAMPAGDVVCEGRYIRKNYLLILIIDGGLFETYTLEPGAEIILPEVPMKEGYTFSWEYAPETMPMEDVVCEGHYAVNSYMVSYYVGKKVVEAYEVAYGEAIPEYDNDSTTERITILGWIGDTYETMPAHDVSYMAIISSGIDSLTADGVHLVIFDINGRRILDVENLKEGIYIVNGKKVMLKRTIVNN